MKITSKTLGAVLVMIALVFVLAPSARASLVIEQTSAPVLTGSWSVDFFASGVTFDKITGTILSSGGGSDVFESLALPPPNPSGWSVVAGGTPIVQSISGTATSSLLYTATFTGLPTDVPPVTVDFSAYDQGVLVGDVALLWNQADNNGNGEFDVVPEPTTIIAGVLLLLPLGASTLRTLRKQVPVA